jgi:soluble lytic murein transglycosylase-like protein
MTTSSPMTLPDYFRLAGRTARPNRPTPAANRPLQPTVAFSDLLAASTATQQPSGGSRPWTVADYQANPVYTRTLSPKIPAPGKDDPTAKAAPAKQPVPETTASGVTARPNDADPVSVAASSAASATPPPASQTEPQQRRIDRCIRATADRYRLPPDLIRGVIQAESAFQADAVSPAGAQGLMQLMPATARELGVDDPFDIEANIDGGSRYLKQMLDRFGGDLPLALAAYNAGPGTVARYNGRVPYAETRQYVRRVLASVQQPVPPQAGKG